MVLLKRGRAPSYTEYGILAINQKCICFRGGMRFSTSWRTAMANRPCIEPEGLTTPIGLGITFGRQVDNDAKTVSGTTGKTSN